MQCKTHKKPLEISCYWQFCYQAENVEQRKVNLGYRKQTIILYDSTAGEKCRKVEGVKNCYCNQNKISFSLTSLKVWLDSKLYKYFNQLIDTETEKLQVLRTIMEVDAASSAGVTKVGGNHGDGLGCWKKLN